MNSEHVRILLLVLSDMIKQEVLDALLAAGFSITEIGSTSSLFSTGFTTVMAGVPGDRVDEVVHLVREHSHTAFDPGEKHAVVYVLGEAEAGVFAPEETA